jgi:signal transduction histidine kinase
MVIVASTALVLAVAATFGPYLSPLPLHWSITPFGQAVHFAGLIAWLAALVITYRREPDGPMWKLIFLYIAAAATWLFAFIPGDLTWTLGQALDEVGSAVIVHLVLAFPTGRLRDAVDRRLVAITYAFAIAGNVGYLFFWQPPWQRGICVEAYCPKNVLLLWPSDDVLQVFRLLDIAVPIIAIAVVAELIRHWRAAGAAGRRALTPLLVGVPIHFAVLSIWYVAEGIQRDEIRQLLLSPIFTVPSFIIPVGFLIGIVMTRLHRGSVADLVLELARGVPLGGLEGALGRAIRDPSVRLAFAAPSGPGFVDPSGRPVDVGGLDSSRTATRLERDGQLLGVLIHDAEVDGEDPGLVDAVGSIARLALENERLAAQVKAQLEEVRASRARIAEAADDERRRIERDLHDGAQQRLVALAMRLETARLTASGASGLLDHATEELRAAIGEVRDLARGVHPPILTESGLGAAIESLAERTPVPVVVSAPDARYPAAIEAAAYFVVTEALTNVARHAGASEARVTIEVVGRSLVVTVQDDGRGGADPARGTGIAGLRDRVAAAGGVLDLASPAGGGTSIQARLPLP